MCRLLGFPALAGLGLNGLNSWIHDVVKLDRLPRPSVVLGGGQAGLRGRLELGVDRGVSLAPHHSVHPAPHHSATLLCSKRSDALVFGSAHLLYQKKAVLGCNRIQTSKTGAEEDGPGSKPGSSTR